MHPSSPCPPPAHAAPTFPRERTLLVEAAKALFFQRGIAAVALSDVAHHVRLLEGTLHHWFAGKSALVAAVVEAHAQAI